MSVKLPMVSRIWRTVADGSGREISRLSLGAYACQPAQVGDGESNRSASAYHFRTPSLHGRLMSQGIQPPAFSAGGRADRKNPADRPVPRRSRLTGPAAVASLVPKTSQRPEGIRPCLSDLHFSRWPALPRWQLAATPQANRPSSGAASAPAWPSSRTGTRSPGRPSGQRATCSTARPTRNAVTDLRGAARRAPETFLTAAAPARRGGVLAFELDQTRDGTCSRRS